MTTTSVTSGVTSSGLTVTSGNTLLVLSRSYSWHSWDSLAGVA
jgi:hypothetical protein